MKNKKGFTLIELLAVIVILAIIALIATPIILNMINEARKSSAKSAALGYIDAIEYNNGFAMLGTDANLTETYTPVISGQVSAATTALGSHLKGKAPTSGTIEVNSTGKVISANNLCFNGYAVDYDGKNAKVKGKCSGETTSTQTYTAYSIGQSINYNPVSGELCDSPTSTTGTKTGCMKWYVIKESGTSDETVDVILDHNTTATVAWNSNGSNASMGEVATQLATDATGWTSGLNPRLITADEIAHIVGADSESTIKWSSSKNYGTDDIENKSSWFYLDGSGTTYSSSDGWQKQVATSQGASNYKWLFDYTNGCRSYGCNEEESSNYGYWTSSPVSDISSSAWFVGYYGSLGNYYVGTGNDFGVRPVITIDKSKL